MTEQEAIAIIKKNYPKCCKMVNGRYEGGFDDTDCELGQAFNIAIQALEEVQQYREIGTLEECRTAREKQIPMKPKTNRIDSETIYCKCPSCNITTVLYRNCIMNYCKECGQKLDWSDEE